MVTLAITKELVTECKRDLNYFSSSVEAIIGSGLQAGSRGGAGGRRDLEISARAASTFYALASFIDPSTAAGDRDVGTGYRNLLSQLAKLSTESNADREEQNKTRLIGLGALAGAVGSDALYKSSFAEQASTIVPALLINLLPVGVDLQSLEAEATKVAQGSPSYADYAARRRPVASRRVPSLAGPLSDEEKAPSSENIASAAMGTLQTLLHNGDATHVQTIVATVVKFLDGRTGTAPQWSNREWCSWLARAICQFTALQYRFVVLTALVEFLIEDADGDIGEKHYTSVSMITQLLNGDLSMIGLSTSDTANNLLGLVVRRIHSNPQDAILPALVECISALGTHIYYADQLNDMAEEISARIIALQLPEPDTAEAAKLSSGDRRAVKTNDLAKNESIRVLLACLVGLMNRAHQSSGEVQKGSDRAATDAGQEKGKGPNGAISITASGHRNRISTSVWHQTASLLASPNHSVRLAYAQALAQFLETEVSSGSLEDRNDPLSDSLGSKLSIEATGFTHSFSAAAFVLALSKTLYAPTEIHESPLEGLVAIDQANADGGATSRSSADATSSALPVDYAGLSRNLSLMYDRIPIAAVLGTVPGLLALDRSIGSRLSEAGGIGGATAQRRSAARTVVVKAFDKIAEVWDVGTLKSKTQSALTHTVADNLPQLPPSSEGLTLAPDAVPFSDTSFVGESSSNTTSTVDAATVVDSLSNSAKVQSATGLDSKALKSWFSRDWSVSIAVDDSFIGASPFKLHEDEGTLGTTASTLPMKIIDGSTTGSAYAKSTNSASKGVGVDDFREALGSRSYGSGRRPGGGVGIPSEFEGQTLTNGEAAGLNGSLTGTSTSDRRASRRVSRKVGATQSTSSGGISTLLPQQQTTKSSLASPQLSNTDGQGGGIGGLLDSMHIGMPENSVAADSAAGSNGAPHQASTPVIPPYAA